MSTISSKQVKRQGLIDPLFVLALLVLILTLMVFAPFNGSLSLSISGATGSFENSSIGPAANTNVSFASDQQYWDSNCSHGWSSDSACDDIVRRSQSCAISVDSAYCSAYESYLQTLTK